MGVLRESWELLKVFGGRGVVVVAGSDRYGKVEQ